MSKLNISSLLAGGDPVNINDTFFNGHTGAKTLSSSPGDFISNLLPNIIIAAGIVFVVLIIVSGFQIISNAGGGSPQSLAKNKQSLFYGTIGFLIVISAYFILQIVSVSLTGDSNTLISPITQ